MRGPLAQDAEVARRAHQTLAEMLLPDAVDEHAGRERIGRAGNRLGQLFPPAAGDIRRGLVRAEHLDKPTRHLGAKRFGIAAHVHLQIPRLLGVLQRVHEGKFLLPLLVVLLFLAQRLLDGLDLGLRNERQLDIFGAGEYARQRVVIDGRDRIVLVIVAAGAGDGQSEEAAGQRVDPVGNLVHSVPVAVIDRAAGKVAQGRKPLVLAGSSRFGPSYRSAAICWRMNSS